MKAPDSDGERAERKLILPKPEIKQHTHSDHQTQKWRNGGGKLTQETSLNCLGGAEKEIEVIIIIDHFQIHRVISQEFLMLNIGN